MSSPLSQSGGGSGGTTAPGGNNTDHQYNNNSAFGGFADGTSTQVLHGGRTFSQVVNADIANTTIDLTAKVTGQLPPANGGVAELLAAGDGFFYSWGLRNEMPRTASANNAAFGAGANVLEGRDFNLSDRITIRKVTIKVGTTVVSGKVIAIGIYSGDKNTKLLQATFDASVAGIQTVTLGAAVTLDPGHYWFMAASDNATITCDVLGNNTDTAYSNRNFVRQGTAANAMVSQVMPATLGTITGATHSDVLALFES
jgi:hypothetical protein